MSSRRHVVDTCVFTIALGCSFIKCKFLIQHCLGPITAASSQNLVATSVCSVFFNPFCALYLGFFIRSHIDWHPEGAYTSKSTHTYCVCLKSIRIGFSEASGGIFGVQELLMYSSAMPQCFKSCSFIHLFEQVSMKSVFYWHFASKILLSSVLFL